MVEEWGIRKTKRFLLEQIRGQPWEIGKISRSRKGDYHVLFLNPKSGLNGYQTVISAIKTIHELQKGMIEAFGRENAPKPRPVVTSLLINPVESPQYAFRMNVILPPWAFPVYTRLYGPKKHRAEEIAKAMATNFATLRAGPYSIPVIRFSKADLRVKEPLKHIILEKGIPPHVIGGNVHETAGVAALLAENTDWAFARNIYITVLGRLKTRWKKAFGRVLTEIDALATNGKNVHIIEVKSVGPRTIPRWDEIVVHKAQTLTPGIEYIGQTMGPMRTRIFPHFVVVSNSEHVATDLANRALITLKPHETFRKLMVHAVWPSDTTLLKRSFREPWW